MRARCRWGGAGLRGEGEGAVAVAVAVAESLSSWHGRCVVARVVRGGAVVVGK